MRRKLSIMSRPGMTVLFFAAILAGAAPAAASYEWHTCAIEHVQVVAATRNGEPRIAVKCAASIGGGVDTFAYEVYEDEEIARMLLATLTAAKIAGRSITIGYESTDKSGKSWGCGDDCRPIRQIMIE